MALIGLDIGTTGCKSHIFSNSLELLASATREYSVDIPHPQWAEQDAEHVWNMVLEVLYESVRVTEVGDQVVAIGLSVQGEAVVPVDTDGYAMRPMILGMDTRTDEQNQWLQEKLGSKYLFEKTGMPIHTINTLPKLLWLKTHEPVLWEEAPKFLLYEDFIINKMAHQTTISECLASRTQLFDLKENRWSNEILDAIELDSSRLSTTVPSGTAVGYLDEIIAEKVGISSRPIIVTGGHDQACGALGAGLVEPGLAMVSTGSAEVVEVSMASPHLNDILFEGNMSVYHHAHPGLYVVMTLNQSGGFILRWFRDNFCQAEMALAKERGEDVYDLLLRDAISTPGSLMLLPHFSGAGTPTFDTRSKGALIGLTFATKKSDIAKAIIEGLTLELRLNLEVLQSGGVQIDELRAIGGGGKSDLWLQMKADVTKITVAKPKITEAAGMGAAILAGVAAGLFVDPASAINEHLVIDKYFYPNPVAAAQFDERFEKYKKLYPSLKEFNHYLLDEVKI